MKPLLLALITLCAPCLSLSLVWAQPVGSLVIPPDAPLKAQFNLETGRYGMPAVVVGTSIYVLGGGTPTGLSGSIERIDTTTNQVSNVPTATIPRVFHSAEAVGDSIYIFGGEANRELVQTVECFDTRTGKLKQVAPLPALLRMASSVAVDGKIYVVGGADEAMGRQKSLWIYAPQTDQWTQGAPMRVARECDVVAVDKTIYAIGGFDGGSAVTTCEAYDIATNTWRDTPPLPVRTSAHHLAQVGDSIWSFGDYSDMRRIQRFDLKTQTWQFLNQTGFVARRHAAVCSVGDKIYVIGGNIASAGSYLDYVQIFDATQLK